MLGFLDEGDCPEDPVCVLVIPVIAQFVLDIEDQEQAEHNSNGQAQDVEQAVPFVPLKIPQGDDEHIL
jgi:hypothetical protein